LLGLPQLKRYFPTTSHPTSLTRATSFTSLTVAYEAV